MPSNSIAKTNPSASAATATLTMLWGKTQPGITEYVEILSSRIGGPADCSSTSIPKTGAFPLLSEELGQLSGNTCRLSVTRNGGSARWFEDASSGRSYA